MSYIDKFEALGAPTQITFLICLAVVMSSFFIGLAMVIVANINEDK